LSDIFVFNVKISIYGSTVKCELKVQAGFKEVSTTYILFKPYQC